MSKYLISASYTPEGVKGLQSDGGSARRDVVAEAVQGLGGTLEGFYYGFGENDAYAIADLPDNESAAALVLAVNAGGGAVARTVVLLTPEEVDAAAERSVAYRPPGA
jgi:uncharacterized protein with GYD domain